MNNTTQQFIGTKRICAIPMTRAEYNTYRGWELPADECGADAGYLVEHLDGGKPNHHGHAGYISWSPKEQFDAAYRPVSGLNFGLAIEALKAGKRVTRVGWNGKGMWLCLSGPIHGRVVDADNLWSPHNAQFARECGGSAPVLPCITMKTAGGAILMGWLASQTDMLAEDWQIVE